MLINAVTNLQWLMYGANFPTPCLYAEVPGDRLAAECCEDAAVEIPASGRALAAASCSPEAPVYVTLDLDQGQT